jgi:hypothetical protein
VPLTWYFHLQFLSVLPLPTDTHAYKVPPPKQKSKRKRGPDIVSIPLNEDEVFHEVTVVRRNKRIHTSSEPVFIPLPSLSSTLPHVDPIVGIPERDGDVYSDEEVVKPPPATRKRERKGPSRSVSVCLTRLYLNFPR